jgi:hypothetical protein
LIEQTVAKLDEAFYPDSSVKPFMIPKTKGIKLITKDN